MAKEINIWENFMNSIVRHKHQIIPIALLAVMLAIGACVFRDYGVSVDEPTERTSDILSYIEANRLLLHRVPEVFRYEADTFDLNTYADRYYGVAIRLPLVVAEDIYYEITGKALTTQFIFWMRHAYVYLIYVGALLSFYFLLYRMNGSIVLAVAGALLVYTFGRFFAAAFYDIKDMVFVSLIMYSIACAERIFATERKKKWCVLFAFLVALAVACRIVAAILAVLILLIFAIQDFIRRKERRLLKDILLPYVLVCCSFPFYLLMSPAGWRNPIEFCAGVIDTFSSYEGFHGLVYFGGEFQRINLGAGNNSWDYTIRWIFLTVPVTVMILTGFGAVLFLRRFFKKERIAESEAVEDTLWMAGLLIISTLGYQFLKRPVLYNSWRHSFFLYPLFVLFSVYALKEACGCRNWIRICSVIATAVCLLYQGEQLIRLHPFQMVSMNPIGQTVALEYEGDYWGLSGKQAHEWILAQDDREDIKVYGLPLNSGPGLFLPSLLSLKAEDAARLRLAFLQYNPEYLEITDRDYEVPPGYELVKEFTVYNEVPVCSIYKRIHTEE